jgi:hypothetical protein
MFSISAFEIGNALPFFIIAALAGILGALLGLALYIYFALAMSTIAKKLKCKHYWLAWIPFANLFLFPMLAKRKWGWGFLLFVPYANIVFLLICLWDIYEKRGFDGRWSLLLFGNFAPFAALPSVSAGAFVANLALLGLVAWGKK